MRKHCEEGKYLCEEYENKLKVWGTAEVNKEAADKMVGGSSNPKLKELHSIAKDAQRAFLKAKQAFVTHVVDCLVCSRKLVSID